MSGDAIRANIDDGTVVPLNRTASAADKRIERNFYWPCVHPVRARVSKPETGWLLAKEYRSVREGGRRNGGLELKIELPDDLVEKVKRLAAEESSRSGDDVSPEEVIALAVRKFVNERLELPPPAPGNGSPPDSMFDPRD